MASSPATMMNFLQPYPLMMN